MQTDSPRSWSVERRLQFIEYRLFWEGRVNRGDLTAYFGISAPQASADLARYQELAGENLKYDPRARTYVAADDFSPKLIDPDSGLYLASLRLIADGVQTLRDTWMGWQPSFDAMPLLRRRVDTDTLRQVLDAIHTSSALCIYYQSFSRPEPLWRWITPHAIVFDGRRWHARSWCHERLEFRDFVFARMLETSDRRPDDMDPADDLEWQLEVTVRLGPHPEMEAAQRRVVELDYEMENGLLEVPMRLCLAYYFVTQFGLDADPGSTLPSRQQVVLLNRQEIETLRKSAREASKKRAIEKRTHQSAERGEASGRPVLHRQNARPPRALPSDARARSGDPRTS